MAEPAVGLEERMTRLESEMVEVRYLATRAESDGAQFQAVISGQTGLLNALRKTQMEHGQMLAKHEKRLNSLEDKVDTGFAQTSIGFATMEARFAVLKDGQERITALLTTHIKECGKE